MSKGIVLHDMDVPPVWLGEVVALAAHELGNAMTEISFATDYLRLRQREPEALHAFDELESVVAQAATLVRLIARLVAAPTPAVRIDLRDVIADAMPLLRRLGGSPLETSLPDAAVPIVASRSGIERALFEVALAAGRFSGPDGAKRIAIDAGGPGERVRIVVEAERDARDGVACRAALLPHARALAAAADGALTLRELPSGSLRIEVDVR